MEHGASRIRSLLANLLRAALISDEARSAAFRDAAARDHAALRTEPPGAAVKLDGLWTLAVRDAEAPDLRAAEDRVALGMPAACPFALDEILGAGFDLDAAVARVRKSAATG